MPTKKQPFGWHTNSMNLFTLEFLVIALGRTCSERRSMSPGRMQVTQRLVAGTVVGDGAPRSWPTVT